MDSYVIPTDLVRWKEVFTMFVIIHTYIHSYILITKRVGLTKLSFLRVL